MAAFTTLFIALIAMITLCSAEYKTLIYRGRAYTYAGEEKGDYNETMAWCTSLGGNLPAVATQSDLQFMQRLTGRHRDSAGVFIHPVLSNQFTGFIHWDEDCTGPCCGLVLKRAYRGLMLILKADICSDVKRRKVCKLDQNATVVVETTVRPRRPIAPLTPVRISHRRLMLQHEYLLQKVGAVMEDVEVLEEAMSELIRSKVVAAPARKESMSLRLVDAGMLSLTHKITFLTLMLILFVVVIVLVHLAPALKKIRRKRRSREPVSLHDLVGNAD